jgi:hypothetical protein
MIHGAEHPKTLAVMVSLSAVLQYLGNYEAGEKMAREALIKIREKHGHRTLDLSGCYE